MRRLVFFARAPQSGLVKTRLARCLGENEALKAYCILAQSVLSTLARSREVVIRYSPDNAQIDIEPWLQPGWTSEPQGLGELGDRLARCFESLFCRGASSIVVVGSDCPYIEESDLESAWTSLQTQDMVLGPAADGGYWLIGLNRFYPSVFAGVDWGTDKVLEQTVERAKLAGLSVARLRQLSDVDTIEDWKTFLQHRSRPI